MEVVKVFDEKFHQIIKNEVKNVWLEGSELSGKVTVHVQQHKKYVSISLIFFFKQIVKEFLSANGFLINQTRCLAPSVGLLLKISANIESTIN